MPQYLVCDRHLLAVALYVLVARSCYALISVRPNTHPLASRTTASAAVHCWQQQTTSCRICTPTRSYSNTALFGAKSRNKQADLRRKLELAKKQNRDNPSEDDVSSSSTSGNAGDKKTPNKLTPEEIKERNDRLRFEELLKKSSATVLNDFSSGGYLTKQQEEEEISAARSGVERIFEGDPAPSDCFQELVSIKSENAIGPRGAERLVPWLRKNPERQKEYLVVVTDPRMKSPDLRQAVKNLRVELPSEIKNRLIVVNADSPAENRRWLKKEELEDKIDIYSDEKMEFMRTYTALGEKRWTMTVFVIANERVQRLAREVDVYDISRTIKNAVKSLSEEMRL